ncbi:hypothetical protein CBF60_06385 [Lactobacillus taiwanensis]|nr:hypothetical protein CBF76_01020 [Lactobacillus taiwanensis]OYS23558.1 hypothetical protein CBF66_06690 [Lactobacillus taiwanensis]OYS25361.1 hypothetical protein CBF73_04605 [Lactobacillus taiwanensis]OYS25700.1 hypothetical protein CBF55_01190 [Lactobacillus taiwanensis]OYS27966.1 hypothetical protein CBF60_06385 [Lactobacillus taiwanensis]
MKIVVWFFFLCVEHGMLSSLVKVQTTGIVAKCSEPQAVSSDAMGKEVASEFSELTYKNLVRPNGG